jgi:myo-inositol-1(or 4)-monophosphatase
VGIPFTQGKDRRDIPDGNMHRKVNSFMTLASEISGRGGKGGMVHGVRSLGSATLDMCYVAMGGFDIWWEGGCWFVFETATRTIPGG